MADDLTTRIEDAAAEPASASTDGQSVSERPLSELIEADKYLASKRATASGKSGWTRTRPAAVTPPGSV